MILCCGEALIDMLPRTSEDGAATFQPFPGGAVFNTAIALGRLGTPTGYFGGLSTDLFGQTLSDALSASHVDSNFAPRSERPTTLAFVTLNNGQAQYAFYDENTAGRMLSAAGIPALSDEVTALFFGGISLVSEPAADTFAEMCISDETRPIMLDPNIRPGFITDEARYRARLERMMPRADVIKLSDEDMEWLGTNPEEMLKAGASVVLITLGAKGVEIITREGSKTVPARRVSVVDTVGAGDTFNAGFLSGLHDAGLLDRAKLSTCWLDDLAPAAQRGVNAAAVTVGRAGANPPWSHEL